MGSKHNDDEQFIWESSAGGAFTVAADESSHVGRGTAIILHLKEDMAEYLEERRLKDLVRKHSEFIGFPINLWVEKTTEEEVDDDDDDDDEDDEDDEEQKEKKKKKVKKVSHEWEMLNKQKPIWMR